MKDNEAIDLLLVMRGGTKGGDLPVEKEAFWRAQLGPLDAELATEAVLAGIQLWDFFPSWGEFSRIYHDLAKRRRERLEGEERRRLEDELDRRSKLKIPLWVKRWWIARHCVTPPDLRRFPEMDDWADPTVPLMPPELYVEEARKLEDVEMMEKLRKAAAAGEMIPGNG